MAPGSTVGEFFGPVRNSAQTSARSSPSCSATRTTSRTTRWSQNKDAVEKVANVLIERKEIHGDDVVDLLNGVNLKPAKIDYLEERTWPRL